MNCPKCNGVNYVKHGFRYSESTGRKIARRYKCIDCNKHFSDSYSITGSKHVLPRILLLDIETAPLEVYVWGTYKQYISSNQIKKDWYIISWAAKWLYDDEIQHSIVTPKESRNRQDGRVMDEIWPLLDEADIIIGHNIRKFDDRKIKAKFATHNIMPPQPYKLIDTLQVARREFALPSYKQAYLTKFFGLTPKIEVGQQGGFELWKKCMKGDSEALEFMLKYNKQDVQGLEDLYLFLRPYMKGHPNLSVMMDETVCTHCGSDEIIETDGFYYTAASKFPVYRCNNCRTPYIRHKKRTPQVTKTRSIAS